MSRIIPAIATALAFVAAAAAPTVAHAGLLSDLFCWSHCGDDDDDDDNDKGGECHDVDLDVGAECGILTDLDLDLVCDPLSVSAACIADLGIDCGIDLFAACVAELTAECKVDIGLEGALFCDGHYVGPGSCLGGLDVDVDVDVDVDSCLDLDLDPELDLDLGLCLDLGLDVDAGCEVEAGVACHAACDPLAVELACFAELGYACGLEAFAACEAELLAACHAACDAGGAVFCEGGVYVGADFCLGVDIDIGL